VTLTRVFVDASAWVAFFNRRDAHQSEARQAMTQLLRTGVPLATSTWTTYEAITIVRSKLGYGRARRLWQLVNNRQIISMIRVDPGIESAALKLFWRSRDKD
jgi:predicted nucleic acid-binding protein